MVISSINGSQDYSGKKYIHTEDGSVYKKAGIGATAGAIFTGNAVGSLTMKPIQNVFRKPVLGALKEMERLNYTSPYNPLGKYINGEISATGKDFIKASKEAFDNSKLAKHGVEFVDVKKLSDVKDIEKAIPKSIKQFPKLEKLMKKQLEGAKEAIVKGKNACFVPNTNKIYVNLDRMSYASFHEMGHALNKNASKIGKILAKSRKPGMILTAAALLTGIFKRKKVEGEGTNGIVDKVTTFVKDNCGKLAFLGTLPTILEEGLASIRGAKLAKGILSEKNYKLLNKFNGKAWLTYLGMGVAMTAATVLASKVRDAIAKPEKVANVDTQTVESDNAKKVQPKKDYRELFETIEV